MPGYTANDGSISGGHFQWALLDASAFVAGPKPRAMLVYLRRVTAEIEAGFRDGTLSKRSMISTAFGSEFSILDLRFWSSLRRIGADLLGYGLPILPALPGVVSIPRVESDFDRLALRRTALLGINGWKISGWLLDREQGLPGSVMLDGEALKAGLQIRLAQRCDVVKTVLGLDTAQEPWCQCGVELSSPGPSVGNLLVTYGKRVNAIPLDKLKAVKSREALDLHGTHVYVDRHFESKMGFQRTHFAIVSWVSTVIQQLMKVFVVIAVLYVLVFFCYRKRSVSNENEFAALSLVACMALSIVLPRWGLLSAIDSAMYPGYEPRYLSSGAFAIWFITWFAVAHACHQFHKFLPRPRR